MNSGENMSQSRKKVESIVIETEAVPKTTEIENLMSATFKTKKEKEPIFEEIDLAKTKSHFKGDTVSVYDQ